MPDAKKIRETGVSVGTPYLIEEGPEAILDNLVSRAGITAVGIGPNVPAVAAPGDADSAAFAPPADAGASKRIYDRPLNIRRRRDGGGGPAWHPDGNCYAGTAYPAPAANEWTGQYGGLVQRFIDGALARGLRVFLQTGALAAPGLRSEDRGCLPDGRSSQGGMGDNASLAAEPVRAHKRAWLRDVLQAYPGIHGIRFDWPEAPCYKLDQAFQDFSPQVREWATARGFEFDAIRAEASRLYQHVQGGLTNSDLEDLASAGRGLYGLLAQLRNHPVLLEWLRLKSELSLDVLADYRATLNAAGGVQVELAANAFSTPLNLFTGFDFTRAWRHAGSVSPKQYSMHWPMMVEFWGQALLARNPGLDEKLVVRALVHLFDLDDTAGAEALSDYGYPAPDEPHPVPSPTLARKLRQVEAEVADRTKVVPIVHGYGPLEDFRRRVELVAASGSHGVWLNRYGYLSDAKLQVVGEAFGE